MNGLSLINQTLFALSSFMLCVCFNIVFKSCNNVKSGKSRRNQSLGNSFHLLCQRRISSSKHRKKKESLYLSNLGNIEQFADSPCQLSTSLNIATTREDSSLTGMFSFNNLIGMCQQFHPGTHVGNLEHPFRRRRGLLDHSQSVFYFVPQENKISQSRFLSFVLFPVLRAGRTRKTAAEKIVKIAGAFLLIS